MNDLVVAPAGMVMLDTVGAATVALLLDRLTTIPPAGAAHSRATEANALLPPVTGLGDSASVLARIGLTVTLSVCDTPP